MTGNASRWWQGVEAEAADLAVPELPEPWADRPLVASALTPAQQAVLAGLDDQPDGPRLDGIAVRGGEAGDAAADQPSVPRLRPGSGTGNEAGNAPGDRERPRPYRRSRWTEQEQEG